MFSLGNPSLLSDSLCVYSPQFKFIHVAVIAIARAMEEAKFFLRKGYRARTTLELVGNRDKECFLCGRKHRVSYPLEPTVVSWNKKLDNYSFLKSPLTVYTRGMHKFDLARSQIVPACTCNCKSCEVSKCREKNFWNVNCRCCRVDGIIDGKRRLQGVLRINKRSKHPLTYFIEVERIEEVEGTMMDYSNNQAKGVGE